MHIKSHMVAGRVQRRKGAALVETAIVLPVALLLIIGILEFSRIIALRQLLQNAARDGGRYAVVRVVDSTTTDEQVIQHVQTYLAGFQNQFTSFDPSVNIQVFKADPNTGQNIGSWKDAGFGEYIAVRISGSVKMALMNEIPMSVQSTMYSEAN